MQKKQMQQLHILAAASLLVTGAVPYSQLKKDESGNAIHSGVASNGQEVHSLRSKIEAAKAGKPATITLTNPSTGAKVTMTTIEAEVAFAQALPELAAINQGKQS